MDAKILLSACEAAGIDFYAGVPDSQLKGLCDTLFALHGTQGRHIVAANEGGAIALCAGHYLATGKPGLCYMQNSGLGNAVNPLASLMDDKVYGLPCLMVIGWRGEPGVHDEPQHVKQGEITLGQLELLDVPYFVLSKDTSEADLLAAFEKLKEQMDAGRCVAIVVRKGALSCSVKPDYINDRSLSREEAAEVIVKLAGERDIFVSTTGKLSRELFEIRERLGQGHEKDFLTVGSMGHASMIALGIAMEKPERRVWCLDGDGAALMHLGALSVLGQRKPHNLIHVVINNAAHETVGGMPVCEGALNLSAAADAAGYENIYRVSNADELAADARQAMADGGLTLIEVMCAMGARDDLGRPTTTPKENRDALMTFIREGQA